MRRKFFPRTGIAFLSLAGLLCSALTGVNSAYALSQSDSSTENDVLSPLSLYETTTPLSDNGSGVPAVNVLPQDFNPYQTTKQDCPPPSNIPNNPSTDSAVSSAIPETIQSSGKTYELVWNDEFCGTKLDRNRWHGRNRPENGEMHYVNLEGPETNPESTLWVKDGIVHLRANHDEHEYISYGKNSQTNTPTPAKALVKSTSLTTQGLAAWKYGRFEVRLKTNIEPGNWPAVWLLPQNTTYFWPNDGEIDWFENIARKANINYTTLHSGSLPYHTPTTGYYDYSNSFQTRIDKLPNYQGSLDEFHTWIMEWDENEFRFYVDEDTKPRAVFKHWHNRYLRENGTVNYRDMPGPFNTPFYLIMNLAYGGWADIPKTNGVFDPTKTDFTKTMQIDYVRVYQTRKQQEQQNQVFLAYDDGGYPHKHNLATSYHTRGETISDLPVLDNPLATFQGWYLDSKLSIPAPARFRIMSDTTLFAKWESKKIITHTDQAKFSPIFTDVRDRDPFAKEISWLAGSNITTGYADGTYRPYDSISREAMAAFLYRLSGKPNFTPPAVSPFRDVSPAHPFYKEISWAASTGITTGYPDRTFHPQEPISRGAMAAFLYRYANKYPQNIAPAANPAHHLVKVTDTFTDVKYKQINRKDREKPLPETLFHPEITWAAQAGITTGYKDGSFKPWDPIDRNAMAAFLYRLTHSQVE